VLNCVMTPRAIPRCRSDRLTHCAFERVRLIRRSALRISSWPAVYDRVSKAGHMTAPFRRKVALGNPCQTGRSTYESEPNNDPFPGVIGVQNFAAD
jgi:hypothetical protein